MRARRPALVLLAALAVSACGPSKEEERIKELKRICQEGVGKTVRDLEIAFADDIRIAYNKVDGVTLTCGSDVSTLQCSAGPSRCVLGFWFPPSNDPNTCEQTGCFFACDVRAESEELKAHAEDHLAPICGTRWVSGQPSPGPFYLDPPLFIAQDGIP